jgi:hypothetical protein
LHPLRGSIHAVAAVGLPQKSVLDLCIDLVKPLLRAVALVNIGPINPREFAEVTSTTEVLGCLCLPQGFRSATSALGQRAKRPSMSPTIMPSRGCLPGRPNIGAIRRQAIRNDKAPDIGISGNKTLSNSDHN